MTDKKAKTAKYIVLYGGIITAPDGTKNPKVGDELKLTEDQAARLANKIRPIDASSASKDGGADADQVKDLQGELKAETKRADDAEKALAGAAKDAEKALAAETKRADKAEKALADAASKEGKLPGADK